MERWLYILKKCALFEGFAHKDILAALRCLNASVTHYGKEQAVALAGDALGYVGVVLGGTLHIRRDDAHGNTVLIGETAAGDMFGEAFVCVGMERIPVSVWAVAEADVMRIDYKRLMTVCPSACEYHTRLITNMMKAVAGKLVALNQKLEIVQKGTIRAKLTAYLEMCARRCGGASFTVPLNRNALAEYLGVNRSALSRELCAMRDEGLLEFSGRAFTLTAVE